jgi:hypothetical protein
MIENLTKEPSTAVVEKAVIDEEEFFERTLFQDVLEMKSLKKVSEVTATGIEKLQDQAYQCLFSLYQKARGVDVAENQAKDEIFTVFEMFFKSFYQYFRLNMETLIATGSPIKIAYILGKKSDLIISMLDQFVKEIEKEIT